MLQVRMIFQFYGNDGEKFKCIWLYWRVSMEGGGLCKNYLHLIYLKLNRENGGKYDTDTI